MALGLFHFQLMYDILQELHFIYDEEKLAAYVVDKLSAALNAEAGTVFRLEENGDFYPLAAFGTSVEKLRSVQFKSGKGVVGWVIQYMQPVKVENPANDPRFFGGVDVFTGFKTRSIIATPIVSKNKPRGVLEFLNRKDRPFALQDLEMISVLGREIGIAFENIHLIKELQERRAFQDAVTNSLSAGLLIVDQAGNLLEANPQAREILNLGELKVKQPVSSVLKSCPSFEAVIELITKAEQPIRRQAITLEINGAEKRIGYSGVPILSQDGARLGSAILFQDITNL